MVWGFYLFIYLIFCSWTLSLLAFEIRVLIMTNLLLQEEWCFDRKLGFHWKIWRSLWLLSFLWFNLISPCTTGNEVLMLISSWCKTKLNCILFHIDIVIICKVKLFLYLFICYDRSLQQGSHSKGKLHHTCWQPQQARLECFRLEVKVIGLAFLP